MLSATPDPARFHSLSLMLIHLFHLIPPPHPSPLLVTDTQVPSSTNPYLDQEPLSRLVFHPPPAAAEDSSARTLLLTSPWSRL